MTDPQENALDAFGPILIKQGYQWIDINDISEAAEIEP